MRFPLILAAVTCLAVGCTQQQLDAVRRDTQTAETVRADAVATRDAANVLLAAPGAATQPTYKALQATTQQLDKTADLLGKAIEVTKGATDILSAATAGDQKMVDGVSRIAAVVPPNPYTPLVVVAVPLVAMLVQQFSHRKQVETLTNTNTDMAGVVAQSSDAVVAAHKIVAEARAAGQ